jgi:hypothetical protein
MTTQAQAYAARCAAHNRALQEADAQILAAHNRHRHAQDELLRGFAREDLEQARAHKAQLRWPSVGGRLPVCVGFTRGTKGKPTAHPARVCLSPLTQGEPTPASWHVEPMPA